MHFDTEKRLAKFHAELDRQDARRQRFNEIVSQLLCVLVVALPTWWLLKHAAKRDAEFKAQRELRQIAR